MREADVAADDTCAGSNCTALPFEVGQTEGRHSVTAGSGRPAGAFSSCAMMEVASVGDGWCEGGELSKAWAVGASLALAGDGGRS